MSLIYFSPITSSMNVKSKLLLLLLVLFPFKTNSNVPIVNRPISVQKSLPISEGTGIYLVEKEVKRVTRLKSSLDVLLTDYIIEHEGFVDSVYNCPSGVATIGWGHVLLKGESHYYKNKITEEEALELLYLDLNKRKLIINRLNQTYNLNLNNNQKAALTHFIYALGEGTLMNSTLFNKLKNKTKINKSDFTVYSKYKRKGKYINSNYMKKMRKWEYNLYIKI